MALTDDHTPFFVRVAGHCSLLLCDGGNWLANVWMDASALLGRIAIVLLNVASVRFSYIRIRRSLACGAFRECTTRRFFVGTPVVLSSFHFRFNGPSWAVLLFNVGSKSLAETAILRLNDLFAD